MRTLPMKRGARDSEAGAVAILVAASLTIILIAAAMVLDFGIVRLDRQTNKSAADSAAAAGLRGMDSNAKYSSNGLLYSFEAVCGALNTLKANNPGLAGLDWASCADPAKLKIPCDPDDAATHALYSGTTGSYQVTIQSPYDVASGGFTEESLPTLANDTGDPELAGCDQIGVIVTQSRRPGIGSLATNSDLVSRVRSVGRVSLETEDDSGVALLLLERRDCDAIVINGSNSFVRVDAVGLSPGFIHSDSLGDICSGQQRILIGEHANGIVAARSGATPGLIRVRAIGTSTAVRAYDSLTNVVAEGGQPTAGGLVTRSPADLRYIQGVRQAIAAYRTEAGSNGSGWTLRPCNSTKAELEAVPSTARLWINCTTGSQTFNTANVELKQSEIFFNAKTVAANNLAMPNATRVYISGDPGTNGVALSVSTTSFAMNQGTTAAPACPLPTTTPRARLVIGAGSISANSGGNLRLCGTSVILVGGSPTGCVPTSVGTEPTSTSCNGRITLGGPTTWTAPNRVDLNPTAADYLDLEDLALWTEADGSHDVGGGGVMTLSGVFFLPNGEFKVHGGAAQDVENSQYIARKFRADGGSNLLMAPNPYDVITIPVVGGFLLVR